MQALAHSTEASRAKAPASTADSWAWAASPASAAWAVSHASAVTCSTATSMSARRCLMAWNCPMGRPNWRRSMA